MLPLFLTVRDELGQVVDNIPSTTNESHGKDQQDYVIAGSKNPLSASVRVLMMPNVSIVLSPPLSSGSAQLDKMVMHGEKAAFTKWIDVELWCWCHIGLKLWALTGGSSWKYQVIWIYFRLSGKH